MTKQDLQRPRREIPGPKGLPFIGNIHQFRDNYLTADSHILVENFETYGDPFKVNFGAQKLIFTRNPNIVKQILHTNAKSYIKGISMRKQRPYLGNGLLLSEGNHWLRQRRLSQPQFHRKKIAAFAQTMVDYTAEMLNEWEDKAQRGEHFNIAFEMMRVTLTIITRIMFSSALKQEDFERIDESESALLEGMLMRIRYPFEFLEKLPLPTNNKFNRAIDNLNQILLEIIHERRSSPEFHEDLLQMLMDATDAETGEQMSDQEVLDEIMTIFLAGHETTASTLVWVWYLLDEYPEAQQRFFAEVDTVLGDRPPTAADYAKLPYTSAIFHEAMRLFPVVISLTRTPIKDDTLAGYPLPADSNTNVVIPTYLMHRHPDYWEAPNEFRPERFLNGHKPNKYVYLPFGNGPRICIGNTFALMEGILGMAQIAQKFKIERVEEAPVVYDPSITLRPKDGLMVKLVPRH